MRIISLAYLLCLSPTYAQIWSGIIDSARATDWSEAGVQGGIPTRSTVCATIAPYTGTATAINDAISACASGQVVLLSPAGTYTLSTGIVFDKSGVTLRGLGASQTKLVLNGSTSGCSFFHNAAIRMCAGNGHTGTTIGGGPGPDHSATWSAGYAQGTTVVTLSDVTGLSVGDTLMLDQLEDASDGYPAAGDTFVCEEAQPCSWEGAGAAFYRNNRPMVEVHEVVSINGTDVTIDPPIISPNFRSGQSPGAWWANAGVFLTDAGLEDFSMDFTGAAVLGIEMVNVSRSWVKGVRGISKVTAGSDIFHVMVIDGFRVTIRDNYFFGPNASGNQRYVYAPHITGSCLFENNIMHNNVAPAAPNDPDIGSVYSYNFVVGAYYAAPGFQPHNPGDMFNLFDGNNMGSFFSDAIHGTHHFNTLFRNHFDKHTNSSGCAEACAGIILDTHSRFFNLIGNVIGHSTFSTYTADQADNDNAVFQFGYSGTHGGTPLGNDANVIRTVMRWGNWDSVTSTNDFGTNDSTGTKFTSSEVPSGITNYANAVPGSQTLPYCLFAASNSACQTKVQPWWNTTWGQPPYPPIGPDVASGNITISETGGHANRLPSRVVWQNTDIDTAQSGTARTVTGASCSSQTVTLTIGTNTFAVDEAAGIEGISPAGYNGNYILTGRTASTISYKVETCPGTYVTGGTATEDPILAFDASNYLAASFGSTSPRFGGGRFSGRMQ